MSASPWLSVVIPAAGLAVGLEETLAAWAALARSGPADAGLEVLVVAQGHSPGADRAVSLWRQQGLTALLLRSAGPDPGEARNLGLGQAQGEVVFFTAPGCLPPPDLVARLAEIFPEPGAEPGADPGVAGAGGGVLAREAESPLARLTAGELTFDRALARAAASPEEDDQPGPCPLMCSAAFRRAALVAVGGFADPLAGPLQRDLVLGQRLAAAGGRLAHAPGLAVRASLPTTWGQVWRFHLEEGRRRFVAQRRGRGLPPGAHLQPSLVLLALACLVALWPLDPARAATLALVALLLLYPTNRALLRYLAETDPGLVRWGLANCFLRPAAWLAGMVAAALGRVAGGGGEDDGGLAPPGGGH